MWVRSRKKRRLSPPTLPIFLHRRCDLRLSHRHLLSPAVIVHRRALTRRHISPSSPFFRLSSLNNTDYNHFVISAGHSRSCSSSGQATCLLERTISFTFFFLYYYFISVPKTWRLGFRNTLSVFSLVRFCLCACSGNKYNCL